DRFLAIASLADLVDQRPAFSGAGTVFASFHIVTVVCLRDGCVNLQFARPRSRPCGVVFFSRLQPLRPPQLLIPPPPPRVQTHHIRGPVLLVLPTSGDNLPVTRLNESHRNPATQRRHPTGGAGD